MPFLHRCTFLMKIVPSKSKLKLQRVKPVLCLVKYSKSTLLLTGPCKNKQLSILYTASKNQWKVVVLRNKRFSQTESGKSALKHEKMSFPQQEYDLSKVPDNQV